MKKKFAFLLLFLTTKLIAQQTLSIPDAPKKIEFAGVTVNMDRDAQMIVQSEINSLLTPQNRYLEEKLERLQWYFPLIEAVLEEEEVPDDFKYLAVLESSLMAEAESTSNAIGFWQIKLITAQELGLRIDSNIDERKNIFASTRAAAMYLKRNNLIYHNWISSLFSYRLGATGISQMIPAEWAYANEIKLNGSSDRYILRAIANRIAFEHRINRLKDSPYEFIEYKSAKGKSLKNISSELSFDINELAKYNSWISSNTTIPADKDYSVLILSRREDTKTILAKISNPNNPSTMDIGFPILHRVTTSSNPDEPIFYSINDKKGILAQPGDDVARLASKGKVRIYTFLKLNDMTDKDLIKEGRVYYLQSKNNRAKIPYHTVGSDQTLWEISQMYGVKLSKLLKYNRLPSVQRLQAGRVVWLQSKRPKNQPIEYIKEAIPTNESLPSDATVISEKTASTNASTQGGGFWDIFKKKDKKVVEPVPTKADKTDEFEYVKEPKVEEKDSSATKNTNEPPVIFNGETNNTTNTNSSSTNNNKPTGEVIEKKPTQPTYETPKKPDTNYNVPEKNTTNPATNTGVHYVEQGETLYSLSRKYGISVKDLAEWNGISTSENLKYGQKVLLRKTYSTTTTTPSEPERNTSDSQSHVVQKGETLFSIAKRYGKSVQELQQLNNLADNTISVGQELRLVKSGVATQRTAVQPKSATNVHTVVSGDTMFNIAKRYGVSIQQIQSWNNLTDTNVKLGQQLIIKK